MLANGPRVAKGEQGYHGPFLAPAHLQFPTRDHWNDENGNVTDDVDDGGKDDHQPLFGAAGAPGMHGRDSL